MLTSAPIFLSAFPWRYYLLCACYGQGTLGERLWEQPWSHPLLRANLAQVLVIEQVISSVCASVSSSGKWEYYGLSEISMVWLMTRTCEILGFLSLWVVIESLEIQMSLARACQTQDFHSL